MFEFQGLRSEVRIVLFDAVGTVMAPRRPVAEIYHEFGRLHASRRTVEEIRKRFHDALRRYAGKAIRPRWDGRPAACEPWLRADTNERRELQRWRQIVAYVFSDTPDRFDELFRGLWSHFAEANSWRVASEWGDVRAVLERRGYQVGLASNFDQRLVQLSRQLLPLRGLRHVFCSSQLGVSKPDPRFYRAIERRTGFGGSAILLVGDDPLHDVEVPRQFGWQALQWSPDGDDAGAKPLLQHPMNRLSRFPDLLNWLSR